MVLSSALCYSLLPALFSWIRKGREKCMDVLHGPSFFILIKERVTSLGGGFFFFFYLFPFQHEVQEEAADTSAEAVLFLNIDFSSPPSTTLLANHTLSFVSFSFLVSLITLITQYPQPSLFYIPFASLQEQ